MNLRLLKNPACLTVSNRGTYFSKKFASVLHVGKLRQRNVFKEFDKKLAERSNPAIIVSVITKIKNNVR